MNIKIPDTLKSLIEDLKVDGDFSAISDRINGDNALRQSVKTAIKNGYGDSKIVMAINDFYKEKQRLHQKLTAA